MRTHNQDQTRPKDNKAADTTTSPYNHQTQPAGEHGPWTIGTLNLNTVPNRNTDELTAPQSEHSSKPKHRRIDSDTI